MLKETPTPKHLICSLRNLYAGEEATVRTGLGKLDWIHTGGKQYVKAILLPLCLFNLYAEYIIRKTSFDEVLPGIKLAGRNINHRYAYEMCI